MLVCWHRQQALLVVLSLPHWPSVNTIPRYSFGDQLTYTRLVSHEDQNDVFMSVVHLGNKALMMLVTMFSSNH